MSDSRLRQEILRLSSSQDWEQARAEWIMLDVSERPEGATCLCGHHPIHDLCRLANTSNGAEALVGNCCVKRFLGLPSAAIFAGLKRIGADPSKSMGDEALALALRNGWVAGWEGALYHQAARKPTCSEAQSAKKIEINLRVLSMTRQHPSPEHS
jgi:hypothetical protein